MSKMATYAIVMAGLVGLFYFTGLLSSCVDSQGNSCNTKADCFCTLNSPSSILLSLMIHTENITASTLFSKINLLLAGITAISLIGSAIWLRDARLALMGPMAAYVMTLFGDFYSVTSKIWSINPTLSIFSSLILGPLLIYFGLAILEWWGGTG